MQSFCLLTPMELILIPNCSLLHLYSNAIQSLNHLLWGGKVIARGSISYVNMLLLYGAVLLSEYVCTNYMGLSFYLNMYVRTIWGCPSIWICVYKLYGAVLLSEYVCTNYMGLSFYLNMCVQTIWGCPSIWICMYKLYGAVLLSEYVCTNYMGLSFYLNMCVQTIWGCPSIWICVYKLYGAVLLSEYVCTNYMGLSFYLNMCVQTIWAVLLSEYVCTNYMWLSFYLNMCVQTICGCPSIWICVYKHHTDWKQKVKVRSQATLDTDCMWLSLMNLGMLLQWTLGIAKQLINENKLKRVIIQRGMCESNRYISTLPLWL